MEGVFPTNWNKEKWSEVGTEAALHTCKLNYSVSLMTSFFFFVNSISAVLFVYMPYLV